MAARSLNKAQLIGNLTRDPELRYTPSGAAVCTFGLATNRSWTTDTGEKKESAEFHRLVAWNKLAELCSQLLKKGRKVFVEGRLQTRNWEGQDGNQRTTTEIVINEMIILDSRRDFEDRSTGSTSAQRPSPPPAADTPVKAPESEIEEVQVDADVSKSESKPAAEEPPSSTKKTEKVNPDDIPF